MAAMSGLGASGHTIVSTIPRTAPVTTMASSVRPRLPPRSKQTGVYVPAMSRKIAELSRRAIRRRARGDQVGRWKIALTRNRVNRLAPYAAAPSRALELFAVATKANDAGAAAKAAIS